MTVTKTWSRDMGRLGIDPDQAGLVAGYDMVPNGVTLEDKSGNGNHGTINGPAFEFTEIGPSMKFDGVADYVEIADDPSLDITDDLTLSAWVKTSDILGGNIISKWNVTGSKRSFSMVITTAGQLGLYISTDGAINEREDSVSLINDGKFHHVVTVYNKALDSVAFYIDSILDSTKVYSTATGGIFNSTANLRLGDEQSGSIFDFLTGNIMCPKMITRALTPAEIQAEYQAGAQAINWKSDYGVTESVAAESAPGELSNSPARIESGSYIMTTDTIHGKTCKVIECVTVGILQIPTSYFHGNDTQAAYGGWEFWQYRPSALDIDFTISKDYKTAATVNGYRVASEANNDLRFAENGVGFLATFPGVLSIGVWEKIKLTRTTSGNFELFLNGVSLGVFSNNNTTYSRFLVIGLEPGCKMAWASKNGDCAITKYQGVV